MPGFFPGVVYGRKVRQGDQAHFGAWVHDEWDAVARGVYLLAGGVYHVVDGALELP
jgi:hypothetical protein